MIVGDRQRMGALLLGDGDAFVEPWRARIPEEKRIESNIARNVFSAGSPVAKGKRNHLVRVPWQH